MDSDGEKVTFLRYLGTSRQGKWKERFSAYLIFGPNWSFIHHTSEKCIRVIFTMLAAVSYSALSQQQSKCQRCGAREARAECQKHPDLPLRSPELSDHRSLNAWQLHRGYSSENVTEGRTGIPCNASSEELCPKVTYKGPRQIKPPTRSHCQLCPGRCSYLLEPRHRSRHFKPHTRERGKGIFHGFFLNTIWKLPQGEPRLMMNRVIHRRY